jgi:ribosome-binding factor A
METLHVALAGCADETLQAVNVVSVEPAPHTGRLLVVVTADGERVLTEEALHRAAGFLRAEVSSAVCRRYAPELVFAVL